MKRFNLFLIVAMVLAFLSACAPVAGALVKLDPTLAEWVVIGSTVIVGYLFARASEIPFVAKLLEYFKVAQYKLIISAWLAGVAIQFLQAGILDRIPQMWDNVVTIAMQLIVAVIVTLYSFRLLKDRGVQGFK